MSSLNKFALWACQHFWRCFFEHLAS